MKNIQIKKPYVAPELTVVDFRVERGMQTSGEVQIQVQNATDALDDELMRQALGISPEDFASYYGEGLPSGNAGYFMGSGTSADGGGYFGSYF